MLMVVKVLFRENVCLSSKISFLFYSYFVYIHICVYLCVYVCMSIYTHTYAYGCTDIDYQTAKHLEVLDISLKYFYRFYIKTLEYDFV